MKNKLLLFFLLLCIVSAVIVGFKMNSNATSSRKYGFQPPIDKLYWGMSLEKIEKVLAIKNGMDGVVYHYDKPVTTILLKNKTEVFGYNAAVSLEVYDKPTKEWFPYKSSYLNSLILTYSDVDGQSVKDNIITRYNNTGNDWVDLLKNSCTTWLSKDKIKDMKPSVKKKLQDYWNIIDEHSRLADNNLLFSVKKDENQSINIIVLVYSDKGAVVTFAGETAVQINQMLIQN